MLQLSRRDLIVMGLVTGLGVPLPPCSRTCGSGLFICETALDPYGQAKKWLRPGWTLVPVASDIGHLTQELAAVPMPQVAPVMGFTSPGVYFVVEQIVARRGLQLLMRRGSGWSFARRTG